MRLSLRSHAVALTLLLGGLTLVTVAALLLTTMRMERTSARMWDQMEGIQTAETLEKRLVFHDREQRLYEVTGKPEHALEAEEARRQLPQLVEQARQWADTSEERATLEALSAEIQAYLAHPSPSPATREEASGEMLDRQLQLSRRLVELNSSDAHATLEANQRWERLANRIGLAVGLALAAGVALMLWAVRRQVYWPLQHVRQALLSFRPGAPFTAAPSTGVQEIQDIAHAFNETASRLVRQREAQLGFLAGVAHDLRNPLQALLMATSSVNSGKPLPSEEKLRERFALVQRQVERLARMVDDLLDTTRVEAGQLSLQLEEHDLLELVREAVELHRPLTQAHELVTSWSPATLWVRCDSTRISQVLNNLLSNAIKYSPHGGQVRVRVGESERGAWVEVSDSGVGIPASEHEHIFEPFNRGAAARSDIPGVGLGLPVARRILEAHGGRIEVESEPGRGSTFRLWLPLAPEDRRTPRPSGSSLARASPS